MALEQRVDHLVTWAGPGQAQALLDGLQDLREEFAAFRREMRVELGTLKPDVGTLKADVGALKAGMAELLRRLPPAPSAD